MATFNDVRMAALRLSQQPLSFSKDDFIKVVEDYVNSLPEWKRKALLGFMVEKKRKVVTHEELPRVLREDAEFFNAFVRSLLG
jgi:asparagine synthetase A